MAGLDRVIQAPMPDMTVVLDHRVKPEDEKGRA
jgi:hypothetical protein